VIEVVVKIVFASPDELRLERLDVLRFGDGRDVDDIGPARDRDRTLDG